MNDKSCSFGDPRRTSRPNRWPTHPTLTYGCANYVCIPLTCRGQTHASVDVLDNKPLDAKQAKVSQQPTNKQQQQQQPQQQQNTLVSSALERVWGTARTFGEMGRAVSSTVGRWGKAMADSVAGTVNTLGTTVNSAVGTVLQVRTQNLKEIKMICSR